MLVLCRKIGQKIIIGDDIVITVTDIRGKQVKLGFLASEDIPIHRREVYKNIQWEQMPRIWKKEVVPS